MTSLSRRLGNARNLQLRLGLFAVATSLFVWTAGQASAQGAENPCGSLRNSFGPYEYRPDHFRPQPGDSQPHGEKLHLVEKEHFLPHVESLIRGNTSKLPGPDIDYTLRAFPNHHRALVAVMNLWDRARVAAPGGLPRPAECYFERAIRFSPDDNIVRLVYASFLLKNGRKPEAVEHMHFVRRRAGDNALTHFNLGLLYADAAMFDEALAQAHLSMSLGLGRQELKEKLKAAGRWEEPGFSSKEGPGPASGPAAR